MFKKEKRQGFSKFSFRLFIVSCLLFIFSNVYITSYELTLSIETQQKEKEIAILESDIDGLDMKKQELTSYEKIYSIATAKGYRVTNIATASAVIGINKN